MSNLKRSLYIIEFFLGFAPSFLVLAVGVIFSPIMFVSFFSGQPEMLLYIALVCFGCFGFWGAISLLTLTLHPESPNISPKRLKFYLAMGIVACSISAYAIGLLNNLYLQLCFINPLVVTLHLAYKQRAYLYGSYS
jgi:Na+/proline symporter